MPPSRPVPSRPAPSRPVPRRAPHPGTGSLSAGPGSPDDAVAALPEHPRPRCPAGAVSGPQQLVRWLQEVLGSGTVARLGLSGTIHVCDRPEGLGTVCWATPGTVPHTCAIHRTNHIHMCSSASMCGPQ